MLKKTVLKLLNLIYPPVCAACQRPLEEIKTPICVNCLLNLPIIAHDTIQQERARQKFDGKVNIRKVNVYLLFEKGNVTQKLMYALKYRNKQDLGSWLGEKYADELPQSQDEEQFDILVPIPLHPAKEKQRGYNQSLAIAEGLSKKLNLPVWADGLIKTVNNPSQTKKGRFERFQNASEIFQINPAYEYAGKHICLVDDVLTTGATLEAAAIVLLEQGSTVSIKAMASAM